MKLIDNIPVWGSADENTMRQARNCAKTADHVALMADNHYGYSVPIGGVVAYSNSISPSGVGFDIACFTGSQRVELADGRQPTFLDLVNEDRDGKENFIYSMDDLGNVVIDKLEAPRQTGIASHLVDVYLDNGEVIRSTPQHRYCRRNGEDVAAENLLAGDSLMPLYLRTYGGIPLMERAYRNKRMKLEGYLGAYNPADHLYYLVHHLSDAYNLQAGRDHKSDGPIRHHVDFNKLNNAPDNLKRKGWREHFKIHSDLARERALKGEIGFTRARELNPQFFADMASKNMTALHQRPEFRKRRDLRARQHLAALLSSEACKENWALSGQRGRQTLIAFNKSDAGRKNSSVNTNRPRFCKACATEFQNQSLWLKHWHAMHRTNEQRAHQRQSLIGRNHKVVKIAHVYLDAPVPVYCLTAPRCHNFALAAGVFVHNCGNKAVLTNANANEVRGNIKAIMDDIWNTISFGIGRKNDDERVDHDLFDDPAWAAEACRPLKEMARQQLGTVGSGNHYVDIFADEEDRVWVGVHFGSRGLGHKIATWFLKAGGASSDQMDADPCVIPTDSDLGAQYLEAMRLAGLYAYAGRDWVCARVARIMGAAVVEEVHNHHNFAWREEHNGRKLWVVRKGATPAFPGQKGFVGGSMGETSVIIEGVENEEAKLSLYSTVHGAGRVMGRMEAKGKTDRKTGEVKRVGKVTQSMMDEWVHAAGVELRGAGVDESPHCYKRLPEVLAEHGSSIRVLHTLTPLGVAMASANEKDPYKD